MKQAGQNLDSRVLHWLAGGSGEEKTLVRNMQIFHEWCIMPRVLGFSKTSFGAPHINAQSLQARESSQVSRVKSQSLHLRVCTERAAPAITSTPVFLCPIAYQKLLSMRGEQDTLNAANDANIAMIVSMFSSTPHHILKRDARVPLWAQIYPLKDRVFMRRFVHYLAELRYEAIVLTVDAPIYGMRVRETTQSFKLFRKEWFAHWYDLGLPATHMFHTPQDFSALIDAYFSWEDVAWLCSITRLPVILKGILHPFDTKIAMQMQGVAGVIVSNHGGRQLDDTPSSLEVLPMHRNVINDQRSRHLAPFFLGVDGGVSSGQDVFKGLALGADSVGIGRSALWPLSAEGAKGARDYLRQVMTELRHTMFLAGCPNLEAISFDHLLKRT